MLKVRAVLMTLCCAVALSACSQDVPEPTVDAGTINLTAAHLQTQEVPATLIAGQNYVYCVGCLSPAFLKEVIFAVDPAPSPVASPAMASSPFITHVQFVSTALQPGVATANASVTVSSHS